MQLLQLFDGEQPYGQLAPPFIVVQVTAVPQLPITVPHLPMQLAAVSVVQVLQLPFEQP